MEQFGFGVPAPVGALLLSPESGHAGVTGRGQSRLPPRYGEEDARRRAKDRRQIGRTAAPATAARQHNPHKRTRPAAVTRDGLVQPESCVGCCDTELSEFGLFSYAQKWMIDWARAQPTKTVKRLATIAEETSNPLFFGKNQSRRPTINPTAATSRNSRFTPK